MRQDRFIALVNELALSDIQAANLLGVHKSSWSTYRSGTQLVPEYVLVSLRAFCDLKLHAPKIFARRLNESETRRLLGT
jgi:hypothetical protein